MIKQINVWTSLFYGIKLPARDDMSPEIRACIGIHDEFDELAVLVVLHDFFEAPEADLIYDDDYARSMDRGEVRKVLGYVVGIRLTELYRDVFDKDMPAMIASKYFISDNQSVDIDTEVGHEWERRAAALGIDVQCQVHLLSCVELFDRYVETDSEDAKSQNPDLWDEIL